MNTHVTMKALRRANPRSELDFGAAIDAVRAQIDTTSYVDDPAPRSRRRRSVAGAFAGVSLAVVSGIAVALVGFGLPGGGPVEDAAAAVQKAVALTAASAERSGTVDVTITHDGELWAAKTLSWNGNDLSFAEASRGHDGLPLAADVEAAEAQRQRYGLSGEDQDHPQKETRVVDGIMYAPDPEGPGWLRLGSPSNIDPDSGTTPAEYLAAIREDVGGATLRRLTRELRGLTTGTLADGSTVYSGRVRAGQIARETGFKEGQAIRVLPFGYVVHDEAADPAGLLDTSITVAPDGIVREFLVTWGTWRYTVSYSGLGSTPAPQAPADAHDLKRHIPPS
jgi:hypothetical protein